MWIVIWQSYGRWMTTHGFESQAAAERHADLYQRQKDYNEHIEVRFIELPESAR